MRLPVYVPNPTRSQPSRPVSGSSAHRPIPSTPYQGPRLPTCSSSTRTTTPRAIRTYADRVRHAAGWHLTRGATAKRLLVDADDLLVVGSFDTKTTRITCTSGDLGLDR
jgi:hypothetical protein